MLQHCEAMQEKEKQNVFTSCMLHDVFWMPPIAASRGSRQCCQQHVTLLLTALPLLLLLLATFYCSVQFYSSARWRLLWLH